MTEIPVPYTSVALKPPPAPLDPQAWRNSIQALISHAPLVDTGLIKELRDSKQECADLHSHIKHLRNEIVEHEDRDRTYAALRVGYNGAITAHQALSVVHNDLMATARELSAQVDTLTESVAAFQATQTSLLAANWEFACKVGGLARNDLAGGGQYMSLCDKNTGVPR